MKKQRRSLFFLLTGITVVILFSVLLDSGLLQHIQPKNLRIIGSVINLIVNLSLWCAIHYKRVELDKENSSSFFYKFLCVIELVLPLTYILSTLMQFLPKSPLQ